MTMQRTELRREITWLKISGEPNPRMNRKHDIGFLHYMPEIGRSMMILGREDAFDGGGDHKGIVTSMVLGVEQLSNGLLVRTLNSIYYIEYSN